MANDSYLFSMSISGNLVEGGVDAYEVANSILATTNIIHELVRIEYDEETANKVKINVKAFKKGSLITDFILVIEEYPATTALAATLLVPVASGIGKKVFSNFQKFVTVKANLNGRPPKKVEPRNNGTIEITGNHNQVFVVSASEFRALQSRELQKNVKKLLQPLTKEDSEISNMDFLESGGKLIDINKEIANSISLDEQSQIINNLSIKGGISKVDKKARTGYIDVKSKRIPFSYSKQLPQSQYEILVQSLKSGIAIYLNGEGTLDLEGNVKAINIVGVEEDKTLYT